MNPGFTWLLELNKMPASSLMLIWRLAQDIQVKHYLCIEKCCRKMRVKRPGGHLKCFILYVSFLARDAQQRTRSASLPPVFFLAHFKTCVLHCTVLCYMWWCSWTPAHLWLLGQYMKYWCDRTTNGFSLNVACRKNDRHLLACFSALLSSQMALCTHGWLLT